MDKNYSYKEIGKILKKFYNKNYWEQFTPANFFYMTNEKFCKKRVMLFLNLFDDHTYGLSLFNNRDGLNYLHDFITNEDDNIFTTDCCDCIIGLLFEKKDLTKEDMDYIRKKNSNVKEKNNIIILRYQKGYSCRYANINEEREYLDNLYFLNDLLDEEYNDIIEAFSNDKSVISCVNVNKKRYSVAYDDLPYLESNPQKRAINLPFYEEFKDRVFKNEECKCSFLYLPFSLNKRRSSVLIFDYLVERVRISKCFTIESYSNFCCYVWEYFNELFNEEGVPYKILFNNRDVYFLVVNTFEKLNIECILSTTPEPMDEITFNIIKYLPMMYKNKSSTTIIMKIIETLNNKFNLDDAESLIDSFTYLGQSNIDNNFNDSDENEDKDDSIFVS